MAPIHDRMPVILDPADWPIWLGKAESDVMTLMRPAANDVLSAWRVSAAVNSVRNNGEGLLVPQ